MPLSKLMFRISCSELLGFTSMNLDLVQSYKVTDLRFSSFKRINKSVWVRDMKVETAA